MLMLLNGSLNYRKQYLIQIVGPCVFVIIIHLFKLYEISHLRISKQSLQYNKSLNDKETASSVRRGDEDCKDKTVRDKQAVRDLNK